MSLQQPVCAGRLHQIRLLLAIGVHPDSQDNQGRTPLMYAACLSNEAVAVRITRLLLCRGANLDCTDRHGRTALSYACQQGRSTLVKILIDDEHDINMADKEGNTPLMYVAISGQVKTLREILCIVLKYGLSVDLRNNKGFSAYLLAAKMANRECAQVLKTEGNASDYVQDTEFFWSDKEWAKKERNDKKIVGKTPDKVHIAGTITKETSSYPSTISRLTVRSKPPVVARTIGVPSVYFTNCKNGAETAINRVFSASSFSTTESSIPSLARAHTPDLHAIYNHYILTDNKPAVNVADRVAL